MTKFTKEMISELNLQIFVNSPPGKKTNDGKSLQWSRVIFPEKVDPENGILQMWVPSYLTNTPALFTVEVDPTNPPQQPEECEVESILREVRGNIFVTDATGEIIQATDISLIDQHDDN